MIWDVRRPRCPTFHLKSAHLSVFGKTLLGFVPFPLESVEIWQVSCFSSSGKSCRETFRAEAQLSFVWKVNSGGPRACPCGTPTGPSCFSPSFLNTRILPNTDRLSPGSRPLEPPRSYLENLTQITRRVPRNMTNTDTNQRISLCSEGRCTHTFIGMNVNMSWLPNGAIITRN